MSKRHPPQRQCLLIVEDDDGLRSQMRWCFDQDIEIVEAATLDEAMAALRRHEPQVITLDLGIPPDPGGWTAGFEFLERALALAPDTKVIVVTGREETEHAVRAVGAGAYDFYQKPVANETLAFVVDRAFRLHQLEQENRRLRAQSSESPLTGLVGNCAPMMKVCRTLERVAPTDITTLIIGETGTGKEVLARALHRLSGRSAGPFVAINCAAIPENLLESELFGYEKGAFTGATAARAGRIEQSSGGTLFLDEIGDMPLALQAKILRFLQERVIERLGSNKSIPIDVRVVSATHRNLKEMIAAGTFREDLFYRIAEIVLDVPPVRQREGDAVLIANALLNRFAGEFRKDRLIFSTDALSAISNWEWPGNVREIENRVKRAAIMAEGNQVQAADLDLGDAVGSSQPLNLKEVRERAEMQAIRQALSVTGNNVARASRLLGISRPTLYTLITRFGIETETTD